MKKPVVRQLIIIVAFAIIFSVYLQESLGVYCEEGNPRYQLKLGNYAIMCVQTSYFSYNIGDFLLLGPQASTGVNDIVYYDAIRNHSYGSAFGPGVRLARIIGLPGDTVVFGKTSYSVKGRNFNSDYRSYEGVLFDGKLPATWGGTYYPNAIGMELEIPPGEYLSDRIIGSEFLRGVNENGLRFTVNKESMYGFVLYKAGHSFFFEVREKGNIY